MYGMNLEDVCQCFFPPMKTIADIHFQVYQEYVKSSAFWHNGNYGMFAFEEAAAQPLFDFTGKKYGYATSDKPHENFLHGKLHYSCPQSHSSCSCSH
jgi:hypothetical protein